MESEFALRGEARRRVGKRAQVNASGHSDVCVCVCDAQATGLERTRCSRGDIRVDRLSGPVRSPSAALRPSRRWVGGGAGAGGSRVHLPVPVQQGQQGTCCTINEHRRHQIRIVLRPSAFSSSTAEGGFLRHRVLIKT
jgi:hypothetical protein